MKIYTRAGDDGSTGLVSGQRVPKHDPRVELYGTSDELNSVIGCVLAEMEGPDAGDPAGLAQLKEDLVRQQSLLFELGGELAGFVVAAGVSAILAEDIEGLERRIDTYTEALPPMRSFVLPGGTRAAAQLHVARTVCRRMERLISAFVVGSPNMLHENILKYVNRLSDFLFVAARFANQTAGGQDTPWVSRARATKREAREHKEGPSV